MSASTQQIDVQNDRLLHETQIGQSNYAKYRGRNFKPQAAGKANFNGEQVGVIKMTKNQAKTGSDKVGYVAKTAAFLPAAAASYFFSDDPELADGTISPLLHGEASRLIHYKIPENDGLTPQQIKDKQKGIVDAVGFNPKSRGAARQYYKEQENRARVRDDGQGNGYEILRMPDGTTKFVHIPKMDFNKLKIVTIFQVTNDKETNGRPIEDEAQLLRGIRSYGASIANIDEEWEKGLEDAAKNVIMTLNRQYKKEHPNAKKLPYNIEDSDTIDKFKNKLREKRGIVVISAQNKCARIYAKDCDLNTNMANYYTGMAVWLSDGVGKQIDHIHGKDVEHKEKLRGERPFKKPIEPAKNRILPGLGDLSDSD